MKHKFFSLLCYGSACVLLNFAAPGFSAATSRDVRPAAFQGPATPRPEKVTTPATSNPVRELPVRELDGPGLKKVLQRQASGSRPLLVTFWATWCEPCREEFPDLVKIDGDYRARGLEFITISLDDLADINKRVPEYLHNVHAGMPAYLLNVSDPDTIIAAVDPKWDGGLPATFLYDAKGEIVFKHVGRIKPDELRAAIDQQVPGKQAKAGAR